MNKNIKIKKILAFSEKERIAMARHGENIDILYEDTNWYVHLAAIYYLHEQHITLDEWKKQNIDESELLESQQNISCLKDLYETEGDILYFINEGRVVEVINCGARIHKDGTVTANIAPVNSAVPSSEPTAKIDINLSNWRKSVEELNGKEIDEFDFGKIIFKTKEEALQQLKIYIEHG